MGSENNNFSKKNEIIRYEKLMCVCLSETNSSVHPQQNLQTKANKPQNK